MDFVEQLKSSVNIVNVIEVYVRLRKSGANFVGLCPFHSEKRPSFSVHVANQFYHCFGCGARGDVLKFVMEMEHISFYEALKSLAERYGIAMPKRSQYADEDSRLRSAIHEMHELAQEHFRANLSGPAGEAARAYVERRGLFPETVERFGLGYSLQSGRALLRLFEDRHFTAPQIEASGLLGKRQDGGFYDRFRNRLMFPIHNESGKVIAFGARAMAADDEPKYLNSPETPIYKKSHVLYNLHRAKEAIRKEDRAILVEGYMDAIGVMAAGIGPVVASCGTALTSQQVQALKRHSQRIVVNFDPDAPGAKAAEKSISLLLDESMHIRIMELDGELDPDEYCKERGADAYRERLDGAKEYFYWLADRARTQYDIHTSEGRVSVLQFLLPAVQRISDRLERMTIANDVASYIGIDRGMVLDSFRKAVADRQEKPLERPASKLRSDEKGLLSVLLSNTPGRETLIAELENIEILDQLDAHRIFQAVMAVHASSAEVTFDAVISRLEERDQKMLAELAFSEDAAINEATIEYGSLCLKSLRLTGEQHRRSRLKTLINQAERAGKLQEAMRLMLELQQLDRSELDVRRGVQ
jgi:DNA primase